MIKIKVIFPDERKPLYICLSQKDANQIRQRFNKVNAEKDEAGDWSINIACPLCEKHDGFCDGCTFKKFRKALKQENKKYGYPGCLILLIALGFKDFAHRISSVNIDWTSEQNNEMKKWLDDIQALMNTAERTGKIIIPAARKNK